MKVSVTIEIEDEIIQEWLKDYKLLVSKRELNKALREGIKEATQDIISEDEDMVGCLFDYMEFLNLIKSK